MSLSINKNYKDIDYEYNTLDGETKDIRDNRKKIIEMLGSGNNLYNKINPLILEKEKNIFNK